MNFDGLKLNVLIQLIIITQFGVENVYLKYKSGSYIVIVLIAL